MPPVTKAGGTAFRKDVAFVTKDDDEQVAAGIVMVPDKVDLQNDFASEDTIRAFAEQFGTFEEAGQAGGGIMHAVWPDGWMELDRNEVLDESEEIGGQTVDAGSWVQEWSVENGDLWNLIDDGILEGYSIGAIQVDWDGPYEQDEVDDVDTSEVPDDELVWELTDGIIREVSAVDIPAVPDAEILEAKADAEKRLAEHVGNQDAFIEEALERGHSEAEAERLWDVLNDAMEADGSSEPGKQTVLSRAGKAFLSVLSGTDDGADDRSSPEAPDQTAAKAGRTLSKANRDSLMASIDASLDVLEDAGVDHGMTRFTDQDSVDFDLSEHDAREWAGDHGDDGEDEDEDEEDEVDNDAPAGDTADDTTDMSNDDDPMADAPEWAKALNDRIDDLEAEKDADEDSTDDPMADAPEWAKDLAERVDEIEAKATDSETEEKPEWAKNLESRIDAISKQAGYSDQIDAGAETDESDSGLDGLGKALS